MHRLRAANGKERFNAFREQRRSQMELVEGFRAQRAARERGWGRRITRMRCLAQAVLDVNMDSDSDEELEYIWNKWERVGAAVEEYLEEVEGAPKAFDTERARLGATASAGMPRTSVDELRVGTV